MFWQNMKNRSINLKLSTDEALYNILCSHTLLHGNIMRFEFENGSLPVYNKQTSKGKRPIFNAIKRL